MKLPVLPIVFALLLPTAALAQAPVGSARMGSTAAVHAGSEGAAKGRAKPAKKPKAKAKAKRARTPGKTPKVKSGEKGRTQGLTWPTRMLRRTAPSKKMSSNSATNPGI